MYDQIIRNILTASVYSELGSLTYIGCFFSFLLIPYGVMALTERHNKSKELLDIIYDGVAVLTAVGILGAAFYESGIAGVIAIGVGTGIVTIIFCLLIMTVLTLAGIFELFSGTPT